MSSKDAEAVTPQAGVSPYATGGGGITFERKVAVQYLAHLLAGDGASELGDGRHVLAVEFQQAPQESVDDLVVKAAGPDDPDASLVLALAVRRSPKLVRSNKRTQTLIRQFVQAVVGAPADGSERRLALAVAGPQPHAEQLAILVNFAAAQSNASGFFDLVRTPSKLDASVRGRLEHMEALVECALRELHEAAADQRLIEQRTWELLSVLTVLMPRLEAPHDTDWSSVANSLVPVARGSDLAGALALRDRLLVLADDYAPRAARVDLKLLRRHAHASLDATVRRNRKGWGVLERLHKGALASVRREIADPVGARRLSLDRGEAARRLSAALVQARAVVVCGESGTGKSALALQCFGSEGGRASSVRQSQCINLRQVHELTLDFEARLGSPLRTLLDEMSAPERVLVIDGADAVAEGKQETFAYMLDAARVSDLKVVAVTSDDSKQLVVDAIKDCFGDGIEEHPVTPLTDAEIEKIAEAFPELGGLLTDPRSRRLLRRLVVVDLLVRSSVSGVPLTDADAMAEVWAGLVRRHEDSHRGSPDAREITLLRLADLKLYDREALAVVGGLDPTALDGLRRDGVLGKSYDEPFAVAPEFAHDEVGRYAVARLLLSGDTPASKLLEAGAPRWALSAAQLACQAWLALPATAMRTSRGKFSLLQAAFDTLVEAGHGSRWADVPSEALLSLPVSGELLRDAWPGVRADGWAGLGRLSRLLHQRFCDERGVVQVSTVEPIISLLLEDEAPWRTRADAVDLLRGWLRAHVIARTKAGHPLRVLLRERLVAAYEAADRRLGEKQRAAAAVLTLEEIEKRRRFEEEYPGIFVEASPDGRRRRRPRRAFPPEMAAESVLELLALLGPDLDDKCEAILGRLADDAPERLRPALEKLLAGHGLALARPDLLARLAEAYYLDDEADALMFPEEQGVRRHDYSRSSGPVAAWHRGPFMALFQTAFRDGVVFLNRLLNHAARFRANGLVRSGRKRRPVEHADIGPYGSELAIAGSRQLYIGDEAVWRWYRGTGVGPNPCCSALQALERVCDQHIEAGAPIGRVISVLLDGCENLAMVGLVVGILVRHLEHVGDLLDPYLEEPRIWRLETLRSLREMGSLGASSEGLLSPERRKWSLHEVAAMLVARAGSERANQLRESGERLVQNALRNAEPLRRAEEADLHVPCEEPMEQWLAKVRVWASRLDHRNYKHFHVDGRTCLRAEAPDEISQTLLKGSQDHKRFQAWLRLNLRYGIGKSVSSESPDQESWASDMADALKLLEEPPSSFAGAQRWDVPSMVAAEALEAHFSRGQDVPVETLVSAAATLIAVVEGPRRPDFDASVYPWGADRCAARVLPLLLQPSADWLRAALDGTCGQVTLERVAAGGTNLAKAVADEVRLYLARGLDHLWTTPCSENGPCHHEFGWRIATETMRCSVLGDWVPSDQRRQVLDLEEPLSASLPKTADELIFTTRLDAAIRALAPAAVAQNCISRRSSVLLTALLDGQRRSLLCQEQGAVDEGGAHALVSARAVLALAEQGDDTALYTHIDAYIANSGLLSKLLRALSAAAEETLGRAAAARRVWPTVVGHLLELHESGHTPFRSSAYGDGGLALAALMPNAATGYLYHELEGDPVAWWDPKALRPEVEGWLGVAEGRRDCVDQLIGFLSVLSLEEQLREGLEWVARLVLAAPDVAARAYTLEDWLRNTRPVVSASQLDRWQEVVDALVVAGVTGLAPHSV